MTSLPIYNRRTLTFALIGALLGLSAAVASHVMRAPIYMSSLVLRVGEVGYVTNTGMVQRSVERPHEMVERLRYEHHLKGNKIAERTLPFLSRVRLSRTDKNLLILEAHGETNESAKAFLSQLGKKLVSDHQVHFTDAGELWTKRHEQLRKHVRIIDGVLDKQVTALAAAPSESDQVHAVRLMQMGILTSHRAKADEDLHLLNVAKSRIYTRPTVLLQKPTVAYRVGMSRRASGLVGGLAGGALGLVFGLLAVGRREGEEA